MKKALLIALALLMLISIAACGNSALKDAAGTYKGVHVKPVGDTQWIDEEFSLELKANGKGTHTRDGMEFNVTWKLDGEAFTMEETFIGDPIVYTGTLKGGVLDIFNGDPEDLFTYEYVYEKQ